MCSGQRGYEQRTISTLTENNFYMNREQFLIHMLAPRAMTFERCSGQIGHEHRIDSDSGIHVRALEQPLPYSILVNVFNFSDVFLLCVVRRTVQRIWYRSSATDTVSGIAARTSSSRSRSRSRCFSLLSRSSARSRSRASCQMSDVLHSQCPIY